jgi:hypothetical protein
MTDYEQLQVDRQTIKQAARQLRDLAIADGYAGREGKHLAFAMALVLDELSRHLRDLDAKLRGRVVDTCRALTSRKDD